MIYSFSSIFLLFTDNNYNSNIYFKRRRQQRAQTLLPIHVSDYTITLTRDPLVKTAMSAVKLPDNIFRTLSVPKP